MIYKVQFIEKIREKRDRNCFSTAEVPTYLRKPLIFGLLDSGLETFDLQVPIDQCIY
jgi:hypothetical protein